MSDELENLAGSAPQQASCDEAAGSGRRRSLLRQLGIPILFIVLLLLLAFAYLGNKHTKEIDRLYFESVRQNSELSRSALLSIYEETNVHAARALVHLLWAAEITPLLVASERVVATQCRVTSLGGEDVFPNLQCGTELASKLRSLPEFRALEVHLANVLSDTAILRLKLFDVRGITVYSSEHGQVGEIRQKNKSWLDALLSGRTSSQLVSPEIGAAGNEVGKRGEIVTVMALRAETDGPIIGVFELYTDAAELIAKQELESIKFASTSSEWNGNVKQQRDHFVAAVGTLIFLLIAGLFALVARLDRVSATLGRERASQRAYLEAEVERRTEQLAREIEQRKTVESMLQRTSDWLKLSLNSANMMAWVWDSETGRYESTRPYGEFFGIAEPPVPIDIAGLFPGVLPQDRLRLAAVFEQARETPGETLSVEFECAGRFFEVHGGFLAAAVGTEFTLCAVTADVTPRKRVEAAKNEAIARFSSILDNAVDGILVIDDQSRIETFNHAAEQIFGYRAAEVLGSDIGMLMPDYHRVARDGFLTGYMKEEPTKLIGTRLEIEGLHRDQQRIFLELSISETWLGERRIITGVVRNIGELKALTAELLRAKEVAEAASLAKTQFLSSMSHELRTPMNAVLGFCQLLAADDLLTADAQESVAEIFNAGQHLLQLINEILDLARIEAGRVELVPKAIDLAEICKECLSLSQPVADQYGIRLIADSATVSSGAIADRTRLKEVLLNLISNAIKYNSPQGTVTVSWSQQAATQRSRLRVTDTGVGLSSEQMAHLFEPFNRLGREGSNVEGSGIGLVIARRLIEAMDGQIGVDSGLGQGCSFWIELPAGPLPIVSEDEPRHSLVEDIRASTLRRKKILYIEDNAANLRLVDALLKKRPAYEFVGIMDSELAMALAMEQCPDLILLDISMPGMNGYEVLEEIGNNNALYQVPVIAVSAQAMAEDILRGKAAGFYDYVTKPIDVSYLLDVIDKALESADNER